VDAIINAANEELQCNGGLAKAILDAGGASIQRECDEFVRTHGKVKPGQVACLGAGTLPCRKVIHAVGPRWSGGWHGEEQELYSAVEKSLTAVFLANLSSIAIPAIGTGRCGVPVEVCARTSINAVHDFTQVFPIRHVKFILFQKEAVDAFKSALILSFRWQRQNDQGSFSFHSNYNSHTLSRAFLSNPKGSVAITISGKSYLIDFDKMLQINRNTGYKRPIQWVLSRLEGMYPQEWQPQNKTTELFSVRRGTPEWQHVERKFAATMGSGRIIELTRIQNKCIWEKYVHEKKRLDQKNNRAINEKELFHGTSSNSPQNIYKDEDGFDVGFSRKGMWGVANYFAVKASYSDRYAFQSRDGKQMFLVKVLAGESYNCQPDSSLHMPPNKHPATQTKYDTATENTNGSQVFMTYDNNIAYPTYLITYE